MECREARTLLLDRRRGVIGADERAPLEDHLAACAACRHEDAADAALSALLEERLSSRVAPDALKRALEARWHRPSRRLRASAVGRALAFAAVGAALAVFAMRMLVGGASRGPRPVLVAEAVNDHLRVLYSEHPLEVQSGGMHQVKPWFEGRLDFAPVMGFSGDDDFPLQGGAVSYFVDRKAAAFVFKRRLHVMTLLVFRADGLDWPALGLRRIGTARGTVETARGFQVAMWRAGDLGYALVSDVNEDDLLALGAKIAGP